MLTLKDLIVEWQGSYEYMKDSDKTYSLRVIMWCLDNHYDVSDLKDLEEVIERGKIARIAHYYARGHKMIKDSLTKLIND